MWRRRPCGISASGRRDGFILLAVLWVMVGIAALGLTVSLVGREAVAVTQNRIDLVRAGWRAEGCLDRTRSVVSEVLSQTDPISSADSGWGMLDQIAAHVPSGSVTGCEVTIEAAGARLDVNTVDRETLHALLVSLEADPARADSLADAILDWRDSDGLRRPYGAERMWYASHGRHLPRNGPLADLRELRRVRGFETLAGIERVLDVEPGRVSLGHAPAEVLLALPGMTGEVVGRIVDRRQRGVPVQGLMALTERISASARDSLAARYAELARLVTVEPDAWIVASRGRIGSPPVTAVTEVRLVRAGRRAAIVRRRTWIE